MKPLKLGIIGGSVFVFGVLFCAVFFPLFMRSQIKKQVALKPGSEIREMWSNFPFPVDFRIYLFNVTNPDEITAGAKPILKEVGPYFYDEYKHKVNLVDREEDDTVEYNVKITWVFNPSRSNGLTGEEILVMPHILILTIVKLTLMQQPSAMGLINKAMDSIFKKPNSVFVRAKAKDILFEGLPIDCTVKDFAGSAVCTQLKQQEDQFRTDGKGNYYFSMFGMRNGSVLPERIRVLRGVKNYKDVGRVTELDGEKKLSLWPEDHCNEFNGTDSTIFPPLMTEKDDIVSFSPEICRSMGAQFSHKVTVKGFKALRYTADLGDGSTRPNEKCYCPSPENCLTKNLYDMYKCLKVPFVGSLPHFYGSEQKYRDMVDGMHPDEEKHGIALDFEPLTATPLSAYRRLQFNMFLGPVAKFRIMKNFPECLYPIFWLEEGIVIPDEFVSKLSTVFLVKNIVGIVKWITIVLGAGVSVGAGALYFKNREKNKLEITKVAPQLQDNKNGEEKKWPSKMIISTVQSASVPPSLDKD
ncbi:sensory neuron membrane protein 1-like [Hylaeus anthracinus]|uniref:sensory neuron membrane protein 1-like n=1 Tax=Hylaeus anthracinus TaxID=313031 RepID=UPI0023B8C613|nr:sensory neuron membrane protein 1-like [Hylaeus anthracinus]